MFNSEMITIILVIVSAIIAGCASVLYIRHEKKRTNKKTIATETTQEPKLKSTVTPKQAHKAQKFGYEEVETTKAKNITRPVEKHAKKQDSVKVETTGQSEITTTQKTHSDNVISMDVVDHLSEYSAYKQFGYYEKAANSLNNHLSTLSERSHDLVIELCSMYLESKDIDNMVEALENYSEDLNKKEIEAFVKTAFEEDPGNLNLCLFAENNLGWSSEYISQVVKTLLDYKATA